MEDLRNCFIDNQLFFIYIKKPRAWPRIKGSRFSLGSTPITLLRPCNFKLLNSENGNYWTKTNLKTLVKFTNIKLKAAFD